MRGMSKVLFFHCLIQFAHQFGHSLGIVLMRGLFGDFRPRTRGFLSGSVSEAIKNWYQYIN